MKTLFLIRGLPGAGKSTFAEEVLSNALGSDGYWGDVECVAADDFMVDAEGNYLWQPKLLESCHRECFSTAVKAMEDSRVGPVIVHNTFTTEKEMAPYEKAAQANGYRIVRLIVENTHSNTSVHNVPDKTLEAMRRRFSIKL